MHSWVIRSVPTGISNSKRYICIHVGFNHRVTRSRESKTHGFSSTCGSTGTWKYLQVLRILNRIKLVSCKHQYVEQNTFKTLCHTVTEPNMARSRTFYHQSALFLSLPLPSHIKNIVSYSYTYPKLIKCSYLG